MDNLRKVYKNHGASIGYWSGYTDGAMVLMYHAKTLDGQPTPNIYIAEGKNLGRANETSPTQQAVLELDSRTQKKLDKGYVRTIEEAQVPVTNSLGLQLPMLATPLDKVKPESIDWGSAFVQPKLDGHRCLFVDGQLYSRGGKEIVMPHILDAIMESEMRDMHLDGELYIHGMPLNEISKLVKKQRPESINLQYHVYDTVLSEIFFNRLYKLTGHWDNHAETHCLQLVETIQVGSMEQAMSHHQNYRYAGYEGTMLRFGDDHYLAGKRSRKLLKMKEFHDAEFTVIGVEEGKPYVRDSKDYRVPVWICDAGNGKPFSVTHPGTMLEKDDAWQICTTYIGQQLTVKYHYLSADGIPQLPIALQFKEEL
tara:strand:+ start:2584 stop:3684 length:1101 start_codon:yes stop_codon:yes gene_type:complete